MRGLADYKRIGVGYAGAPTHSDESGDSRADEPLPPAAGSQPTTALATYRCPGRGAVGAAAMIAFARDKAPLTDDRRSCFATREHQRRLGEPTLSQCHECERWPLPGLTVACASALMNGAPGDSG